MKNSRGDRLISYGKHKIHRANGDLESKTIWKNSEGKGYVKIDGVFCEVKEIEGRCYINY